MFRQFIVSMMFVTGILFLFTNPLHAEDSRPNIVLIMADDMGYSDIGCYGGEHPTPNLDALAEGGVRFTQFYNTGRCCPTRASLMTGLYSHEAGIGHMVYSNRGPGYLGYLNDQCLTIAEVLQAVGYQTMMTGKWHVGHAEGQWPTDRGFEQFYGIHIHIDSYFKVLGGCPVYHNGELAIPATADPPNTLHPDEEWYTTDIFTDWALKFLDESTVSEKPFFLYVAYNSPHWPLEAPDENVEHFQGTYDEGWDRLREERLARMKEMGIVSPESGLPPSGCPAWETLSDEQREELSFRRAIYAAQIERMDQNIGRIVDQLEQMNALEDTLILFLSDNGCSAENGMFGWKADENRIENFDQWRNQSGRSSSTGEAWAVASNTPFRRYKRWVHEGGISTPLIAHWPEGINDAGRLAHEPGHVVDVMATCRDLAGAAYPDTIDGRAIRPLQGESLTSVFAGRDVATDRMIFWEHERHAAVRQGDWKLVTEDAADLNLWELYDMSVDRSETNDQSGVLPDRVESMREAWISWAEQADALPFPGDR